MKTKRSFLILCAAFLAVLVTALAEDRSEPRHPALSSAPNEKKAAPGLTNSVTGTNILVIGYLETRGRTVTIKSGPEGTIYTVKTSDGKILCENVSAAQLRAQAPELHDFIKSGIASNSREKSDARVRVDKLDASIISASGFR